MCICIVSLYHLWFVLISVSPLCLFTIPEPVLCPHILPPKASLTLKCLLQHQPWNQHYELHIRETEENADIYQLINEQLEIIDRYHFIIA